MSIKESSKKKFRRTVMWSALTLIILLIFLSVYGSFLGAERTKELVNSVPLTVYWLAWSLVLITGLASFRRLVRVPRLLLIHGGCVLVLAGAMWGSEAGHKLQKQVFGIDKIRTGRMAIYEGDSENLVALENNQQAKLPFSVKLKDFRLEHYKPEYLWVQSHEGQNWKIAVEIGSDFSLGPDFGTVKILRAFENCKIIIDGDNIIGIESPELGSNPAVKVQIKHADGDVTTQYVFALFPGHTHSEDRFSLSCYSSVRDYISELQIIKNNKVVAKKNIEVNHPLHFGGYHFYQSSYDAEAGQYTVLEVVSDSGLNLVYAGYLMLCVGVFWHFWLRGLRFTRTKVKNE